MDERKSSLRRVAIVKTGATYPELCRSFGDFEDWIRDGLDPLKERLEIVVANPRAGLGMPALSTFDGIVISGSHAMLSDNEDWMRSLAGRLRLAVDQGIPVLGICFGHQLLAQAFGGSVDSRPGGVHLGTVEVTLTEAAMGDPVFGRLPSTFPAQAIHWQSVTELPPRAQLLAHSPLEAHQAFRIGESAWGVQFHPEISFPAMCSYIATLAEKAKIGPEHAHVSTQSLRATPAASQILWNFGTYVLNRMPIVASSR